MIGNRDILSIERLLQVFQVFDGIFQHNLVIQAVLEGVGVVLLGEV